MQLDLRHFIVWLNPASILHACRRFYIKCVYAYNMAYRKEYMCMSLLGVAVDYVGGRMVIYNNGYNFVCCAQACMRYCVYNCCDSPNGGDGKNTNMSI